MTDTLPREDERLAMYRAKSEARRIVRENPMVEVYERWIVLEGEHFIITWHGNDPDHERLVSDVITLPGRVFNGLGWAVPLTRELAEFSELHGFRSGSAVRRRLNGILKAPKAKVYDVRLEKDTAVIRSPKTVVGGAISPNWLDEVRRLPGRHWDEERKVDVVDLTPELLYFARAFGLSVSPEVEEAIVTGPGGLADPIPALMSRVSRMDDPTQLPAAFVAMVKAAMR